MRDELGRFIKGHGWTDEALLKMSETKRKYPIKVYTCDNCKKEFKRVADKNHPTARFCSQLCSYNHGPLTGIKRPESFVEKIRNSQLGSGNSSWRGGISLDPNYRRRLTERERYGMLKDEIIQVLGDKCFDCGMSNKEHLKRWGRRITVHHKDKRGRNTKQPNNEVSNMEILCFTCHGKRHLSSERGKLMRALQKR